MSKHDPFNTHLVTCAKPESAVSLYLSGSLSHSRIKKEWSTSSVSDCDLGLIASGSLKAIFQIVERRKCVIFYPFAKTIIIIKYQLYKFGKKHNISRLRLRKIKIVYFSCWFHIFTNLQQGRYMTRWLLKSRYTI